MPLPPSSAAPAARSQLPSQAGEDSSCFVSSPVYGEVSAQRLLPQGMGVCERTPQHLPRTALLLLCINQIKRRLKSLAAVNGLCP